VVGFETSEQLVADARYNASLNGIGTARFEAKDGVAALRRFVTDGERFDLVIIDPPRSGAAEMAGLLGALGPPVIIYVSCDPQTLGRDLLDPAKKNDYAFITNAADGIGMVTDDFYYTRNINSNEDLISPMHPEAANLNQQQKDAVKKKLAAFTTAYFETAKYLLMNNRD